MIATATQNWDNDGHLIITGGETLKLYEDLKYGKTGQADFDRLGVFCAFSKEQFEQGYRGLVSRGHIKDGDKVVNIGYGCFGTKEGARKLCEFYDNVSERIKNECNPQEVYYFEYNNFECCIDWDGDDRAISVIIDTWGPEVARTIKRFRAISTIDELLKSNNQNS